MTGRNLLQAMGHIDPRLIAEAAPDAPHKKKANRAWVKWAAVAACLILVSVLSLVLIQTFFKDQHSPVGPSPEPGPLDIPNIPYAILEIENITDETVRLAPNASTHLEEYRKVECRLLYANAANKAISTSTDNLEAIYVISESVKALKNQDVILIQVEKMNMNSVYYYGPVTTDGKAEYIPIVDDRLVFFGNEAYTESFSNLLLLNQRILDINEYLARGGKTNEAIKALPKTEFRNGMTLEELIEYFSAWDKVKVESDKLPKPEYPH